VKLSVFAAACLPAFACGGAPDAVASPNLVLISIDSLRADHLGAYGYARDTSPNLDRLAAEGALFEAALSSSSWTLPTHASMFTGLPQSVHGVDRTGRSLPEAAQTLAEGLAASGYRTLGVWSGPYLHPHFGLAQGFERYERCTGYDIAGPEDLGPQNREVFHRSHEDITSPRIVEVVEAWLAEEDPRPFFLFVHMWDVHYDYIPPAPYDERFDPGYDGSADGRGLADASVLAGLSPRDREHVVALYDGEIAWTDMHVGKILARLERLGLADRTVVVVTADHGEEFLEHGSFGHRKALFEESVRVPLVVRGPGVPAGLSVVRPVSTVDLAPTLLELAGAEPLSDVMGTSLVPLFRGEPLERETVVTELYLRKETFTAVRGGGWKLLLRGEEERPVGLWDLRADPGERRNLAAEPGGPGGLGERAGTRTRAALEELARLRGLHTGARADSTPKDVLEELRELGYVDAEE
jgi:arylsulfatase A-like enzyme